MNTRFVDDLITLDYIFEGKKVRNPGSPVLKTLAVILTLFFALLFFVFVFLLFVLFCFIELLLHFDFTV